MANPERDAPALGYDTGRLHASGLKATWPRLKVLQIFRESGQRHLGAEDIYKTLLVEGCDIGLATVYRVLM
jgi:Fur family transcriptional regulator, ferric uptake regulator